MDRPPLLLLNGYAATTDDWDPTFLEALRARSTLLTPDHDADTIEAMADNALAALDAEGIDRAAVAGWSMGGFVAQTLAARAPERVTELVLLSTDPGGEFVKPPADIWAALTDHSGTPREQATRLIGLLFPPRVAKMIDQSFGDVVADARARLTPEWLDAQERAMVAWHREPGAAPARGHRGAGPDRLGSRGRGDPARELGAAGSGPPAGLGVPLRRRRARLHGPGARPAGGADQRLPGTLTLSAARETRLRPVRSAPT